MNKYIVKQKISTLAELKDNFNHDGFTFSSLTNEFWNCRAWVAEKEIEAINVIEAINKFRNELVETIPKLCVTSQCSFDFVTNTFFAYKYNENPKNVIYVFYTRSRPNVGLMFNDEEKSQLKNIEKIPRKEGLFFLMDAANCSSYYSRTAMLLITIESLAGQVLSDRGFIADKDELNKILGNELRLKIYKGGTGLRNKLFHGANINHKEFQGLNKILYQKIINYLENNFGVILNKSVVDPQRNFNEIKEKINYFWKFKNDINLSFIDIENYFNEKFNGKENDNGLLSLVTVKQTNY